jgi:hypothetical protein
MNPGGKAYSAGNSGHEPPPGFLFTNSTGRVGEAMATLDGLPAMPAGTPRCRAGGYPTCASLPRAATGGAGAHGFAPLSSHIHRSVT